MSGNDNEMMTNHPVPVEIKNYADFYAKPRLVKKTTLRTYIVAIPNSFVQICDFEPKRIRMALYVIDADVALLMEPPVTSPDTSTIAVAPQGLHMAFGPTPYEFFGPDAMWLNALAAATRVSVVKEYC